MILTLRTIVQDDATSNNNPQHPAIIKVTPTIVALRTFIWIILLQYHTTCLTGKKLEVNNRPGYRASWAPHGEPYWYIGPAMEHYRYHKIYFLKTISERISDTVELFLNKLSIPKISYTNAAIHLAQDLIHSPSNPVLARPLMTL